MNNCMFVGRLVSDQEVKELESGQKVSNITLAIQRSYKNSEGEYETDFVDCTLWQGVAEKTSEYCKKGDMIGIRGRIETSVYENDKGEKNKRTQVVADKVSFLSAVKIKEAEPDMA